MRDSEPTSMAAGPSSGSVTSGKSNNSRKPRSLTAEEQKEVDKLLTLTPDKLRDNMSQGTYCSKSSYVSLFFFFLVLANDFAVYRLQLCKQNSIASINSFVSCV